MVYSRKRPIETRKRGKLRKGTEAASNGLAPAEDDEYEIEYIIDHKRIGDICFSHLEVYGDDNLAFLVRWKGYESSDDTWEPMINLCRTNPFQEYLRKYLIPTIGVMNGVDDNGNDVVSFEFLEPVIHTNSDSCGYYLTEFIDDLMPWKELSACEEESVVEPASPAPKKRRITRPRRRCEPLLDDLASICSFPDDDVVYADNVLNGGHVQKLTRSQSVSLSQKDARISRRRSLNQHFEEKFHLLSQSGRADLETIVTPSAESTDRAYFDSVSERTFANEENNNYCPTNGYDELDPMIDEVFDIEEIAGFQNLSALVANASAGSRSMISMNLKSTKPVYHDLLDFMAHFEGF
ncbi:hypothetical protein FO519_004501 [Halicephalobus sp. NKZ332]|nr:hypothetical protein FO519_004501 [Halicephalobus sp. NKZ332]